MDLVLIGASDPEAMASFTHQCREHQIPFAADTSWQLARMDGEQVRDLVDGAAYLFCNEYEAELTERKSGWSPDEITERVGVRVTTLGSAGARVDRAGEEPIMVPPITDVVPKEPTGAGDAFRSGFLAAVGWGLSLERAAQLGNLIAVHALEAIGPQDYELKPGPLAERFAAGTAPRQPRTWPRITANAGRVGRRAAAGREAVAWPHGYGAGGGAAGVRIPGAARAHLPAGVHRVDPGSGGAGVSCCCSPGSTWSGVRRRAGQGRRGRPGASWRSAGWASASS